MAYNSTHTGAQIDSAVGGVLELTDNVSIDSLYKITAGITSTGLKIGDLPGFDLNSKIKLITTGHSGDGAPVLYFGRNFADFQHISHQDTYRSQFSGSVNTSTLAGESASDRYFYPTSAGAFDKGTSRTNVSSSTKVFTALHNHQYLIIIRTNGHSETFNVASINIVNGTTVLGTSAPTAVTGTNYKDYYAIVTPTWSVATWNTTNNQKANSFVDFVVPGDAADAEDALTGMVVIDLSQLADDTTAGKTAATAYSKYVENFATLAGDGTASSTKRHGQYYGSAYNMFTPFQPKWFVRWPANTYWYIRQYRANDGGTPIGYLGTIRVGGSSAGYKSIVLDGEIGMGQGTIDFFYSTASDTLPSDPSSIDPTSSNAPLMQYVPTSELGLSDAALSSKYAWIKRQPGICLYHQKRAIVNASGQSAGEFYYGPMWNSNGYTSGAANCFNWGSGNQSMPAASDLTTVISLKKMLVDDLGLLTESQLINEYTNLFSSMSLNGGSWTLASDITATGAARLEYVVNGVNKALLSLENQIGRIDKNPVISTLPTAAGTYKYEVPSGGGAGTWSKEEETVVYTITKWNPNYKYDYEEGRPHIIRFIHDPINQVLYVTLMISYKGHVISGHTSEVITNIADLPFFGQLNQLGTMNVHSIVFYGGANDTTTPSNSAVLRIKIRDTGPDRGNVYLFLDNVSSNGISIVGCVSLRK